MMFRRLCRTAEKLIKEQGGYFKPIAQLFWDDGRTTTIDMDADDLLRDSNEVAQFVHELDKFCVKDGVHIAFVCIPLKGVQNYACMLTGLDWGGGGLIKGFNMRMGKLTYCELDINHYEELFHDLRFEALYYNESIEVT